MKLLIGLACVVIIAAGSLFINEKWNEHLDRKAMRIAAFNARCDLVVEAGNVWAKVKSPSPEQHKIMLTVQRDLKTCIDFLTGRLVTGKVPDRLPKIPPLPSS